MKFEATCAMMHQHADMLEMLCEEGQMDTRSKKKLSKVAERLHKMADRAMSDDEDTSVEDDEPEVEATRPTKKAKRVASTKAPARSVGRRQTRSMSKQSNAQKKHQKTKHGDDDDDASE